MTRLCIAFSKKWENLKEVGKRRCENKIPYRILEIDDFCLPNVTSEESLLLRSLSFCCSALKG